jgi:hypothetical protein
VEKIKKVLSRLKRLTPLQWISILIVAICLGITIYWCVYFGDALSTVLGMEEYWYRASIVERDYYNGYDLVQWIQTYVGRDYAIRLYVCVIISFIFMFFTSVALTFFVFKHERDRIKNKSIQYPHQESAQQDK